MFTVAIINQFILNKKILDVTLLSEIDNWFLYIANFPFFEERDP